MGHTTYVFIENFLRRRSAIGLWHRWFGVQFFRSGDRWQALKQTFLENIANLGILEELPTWISLTFMVNVQVNIWLPMDDMGIVEWKKNQPTILALVSCGFCWNIFPAKFAIHKTYVESINKHPPNKCMDKFQDIFGVSNISICFQSIPHIYHKNQPNVGKYTIHGSYGWCLWYITK